MEHIGGKERISRAVTHGDPVRHCQQDDVGSHWKGWHTPMVARVGQPKRDSDMDGADKADSRSLSRR